MKETFSYSLFGFGKQFEATFTNKANCIEVSDIKGDSAYTWKSPRELRDMILRSRVPKYSKINPDTKAGRSELAKCIEEQNKDLLRQVERNKMLIQMCRKNHVVKK